MCEDFLNQFRPLYAGHELQLAATNASLHVNIEHRLDFPTLMVKRRQFQGRCALFSRITWIYIFPVDQRNITDVFGVRTLRGK